MRFTLLVPFLFGFMLNAKVVLPDVLSDNMVIQQNSTIKLWGTAKAKTAVKIKVSWSTVSYTCRSEKNGQWQLSIKTNAASFQKHTITISDGKLITIQNVLIGEVWLCSGQSNMEMSFNGFNNQPIADANYYILNAKKESGIRMLNVVKSASLNSNSVGKGKWLESSPQNLPSFSATAYFFALRLQEQLKVPIGIINSSYGGSCIEGWLSPGNLERYTDFDFRQKIPDSMSWQRPNVMYQNMLKPFRNYVINGFVWYQGESNVERYATYAQKLQELVYLWRYTFDNADLPFYVVEIAPFLYGDLVQAAKLREAQFQGVNLMYNTGYVCTNDLVLEFEATNIHPSQKKPIGDRLANLVLHDSYHFDTIHAYSPSIDQYCITNDSIVLYFKNSEQGFQFQQEFVGFEVADSTKSFISASASVGIDKNTLVIKMGNGYVPMAVRYCFKNFQLGNVKSTYGLPLVPFRTDDWSN
ncbi:MAG: sialate O-acetylesterase [Crocinitomicaceae bacterium]|nr:sialate O-acetylesterase [Crocinitomicaceae bacterium]